MELGSIFYEEEYSTAFAFVSANSGMYITEIEPDEHGRRFQIVACPTANTEDILSELRQRREEECFSVINRGAEWYSRLTNAQREELSAWYKDWLDVPNVYTEGCDIESIIPQKPEWLDSITTLSTEEKQAMIEEAQEILDWYENTYIPTKKQSMIQICINEAIYNHTTNKDNKAEPYINTEEYITAVRLWDQLDETLKAKRKQYEWLRNFVKIDYNYMPAISVTSASEYYSKYRKIIPKDCIVQTLTFNRKDANDYAFKVGDGVTLWEDLDYYYMYQEEQEEGGSEE